MTIQWIDQTRPFFGKSFYTAMKQTNTHIPKVVVFSGTLWLRTDFPFSFDNSWADLLISWCQKKLPPWAIICWTCLACTVFWSATYVFPSSPTTVTRPDDSATSEENILQLSERESKESTKVIYPSKKKFGQEVAARWSELWFPWL